jgi:hypothetical protein
MQSAPNHEPLIQIVCNVHVLPRLDPVANNAPLGHAGLRLAGFLNVKVTFSIEQRQSWQCQHRTPAFSAERVECGLR